MSKQDRRRRTSTDQPELPELGDGRELLEFEDAPGQQARIKVVGVGGGGGNALNTMIESGLAGVEFVAANTDAQALGYNRASMKLQLGAEVTRGLGCGANPDKGRSSALEARERIRDVLDGADMVFVTAGMGGGTGTGAAPIVAEVARELGALTVGVVTRPFLFEGKVRSKHAERGLDELHQVVDTLITIPNQRLLALAGKGTAVRDAFKLADEVLFNAVRGISDLITVHGLINLDFADVRTIMNEMGVAMMGTGVGLSDTRAVDAARAAISSPLLEDLSIEGARGVLINITGGDDMTLFEVNEASTLIQEAAHEEANIIFGAVIDSGMPEGEIRVTVIATGLDDGRARRGRPEPEWMRERPGAGRPSNVTPLRREAAEGEAWAREASEPVAAEAPNRGDPPLEVSANDLARPDGMARPDGIESPFAEDEYDVPAFLRRRLPSEDEDTDEPAFLRRAQD